jgi:MFS family permease
MGACLLVDRFPKRRMLLISQAGLGLVSLTLGLLVLAGSVGLGQVVVLALAFGTFSAVDNPARQAFVGEVVGRDLIGSPIIGALAPGAAACVVATAIGHWR